MTPGGLLAAVTGAGLAGGIACIVAYATGYTPPTSAAPARWRGMLRRQRVSPRTAVAALGAGLATFAVTGWPVAGIAAVPAVITMPRMLSRRPAKARIATLEALESWTRRLADVLAASRGLEDALTHSAGSAPAAIAGPVADLAARLRTRAMSTGDALRAFADALDDPVSDLIASALILAAERRGPGLGAVLTELASDVAKDVSGRREVEAERAAYRSALVWIVVFLAAYVVLLVVNRSYSAPFSTSPGQFVLAVVAVCWGAGLYWLHRLSVMTGPQRFLRVVAASDRVAAGRGRRP